MYYSIAPPFRAENIVIMHIRTLAHINNGLKPAIYYYLVTALKGGATGKWIVHYCRFRRYIGNTTFNHPIYLCTP